MADTVRMQSGAATFVNHSPSLTGCSRGQGSGVRGQGPAAPHLERGRGWPICYGTHGSLFPALFLVTAVFLAALATGCERQKEGEEAVAWVNGEPILFSVFWDEIKNRYNEVAEASSPQQDVLLVLKKKVLNDLIRERLLLQEASRRGVTVSDEALEARVKETRAAYGDSPLQKGLIEHSVDYEQWRRVLRDNMIMEKLFASVVQGAGKVTDPEIGEYYKEHLDEFLVPETVELSQIVVKDRATAQRLLRLIRKGESFESLAAKYSIGPEKEESGRLGTFKRGELPVPLETAAFATPRGKVTSLVETQYGFHLLKVVRRKPSHVQSEKEAYEEIARKLSLQKKQAFYDEWVEGLVQRSDIRIHASLVQLVVKEESTQPLPFKSEATRETE